MSSSPVRGKASRLSPGAFEGASPASALTAEGVLVEGGGGAAEDTTGSAAVAVAVGEGEPDADLDLDDDGTR